MSETRLPVTLRVRTHGQLNEGLELCFAQLEAEREQTRDQFGYIAGKPEPGKNPLYR